MAVGVKWQVIGRKARNTVAVGQKFIQKGGQVLSKVSEIGNKVLDGVVAADPLLAATPIYGLAKAAVATAGTAGKVATTIGSIKAPEHVGPAITSLRDAYNGTTPPPGAPPGPGAEKVVDHPTAPAPLTAADIDAGL